MSEQLIADMGEISELQPPHLPACPPRSPTQGALNMGATADRRLASFQAPLPRNSVDSVGPCVGRENAE
eukprot:scaffold3978_cov291-Pinguiococcus_pyrenoidosus.AAC.10